jgi:flagellar protein FliJ
MRRFVFKLNGVLSLRKNRRDICRQLLADQLRRDEELRSRRDSIRVERAVQIDELRANLEPGRVNVDAGTSRRFYAGVLTSDIDAIERERELVARQIAACRELLVRADQEVKALEKLAERRREDFLYEEQRREALEVEEGWRAARHGAARSC